MSNYSCWHHQTKFRVAYDYSLRACKIRLPLGQKPWTLNILVCFQHTRDKTGADPMWQVNTEPSCMCLEAQTWKRGKATSRCFEGIKKDFANTNTTSCFPLPSRSSHLLLSSCTVAQVRADWSCWQALTGTDRYHKRWSVSVVTLSAATQPHLAVCLTEWNATVGGCKCQTLSATLSTMHFIYIPPDAQGPWILASE